jgi:hypothetical protein
MASLKYTTNRLFVLSYDGPAKEQIIDFLHNEKVTVMESGTDSTIYFESANRLEDLDLALNLYFGINEITIFYSLGLIAKDVTTNKNYYTDNANPTIKSNFEKMQNPK